MYLRVQKFQLPKGRKLQYPKGNQKQIYVCSVLNGFPKTLSLNALGFMQGSK